MTAAIYYHPEGYTTGGPMLMGRHVAGESFLRGFLTHTHTEEFWAYVQKPEHAQHFYDAVRTNGRGEPVKVIDKHSVGALTQSGVLYLPGPGLGEHAWRRGAIAGQGGWSLCGVTHTISSAGAMDALVEVITAPVQPWDAVICTSVAVKNSVERLLQAQVDYLASRLGVTRVVAPQLPVIPLGVHTADFVFTDAQKAAAREALGVSFDTLVVSFLGRLSFHAKAHPLAMYQALELASQSTGKSVVLVECGWHANELIAKAYVDASRLVCPNVRVVTLDGRKAEDRQIAWAGADVFCSLSDNLQETFGITPIEAMAAGLPVVVSDWDGYRDSVRDGVDGFRIPTLMPQSGFAGDLALRHALGIDTYDMYCGHTCSLVAVDVKATARAFETLFNSSDLRRQMGEAGRARAQSLYDWKHIIGQYESLWAQLSDVRASQAKDLKPLAHPWPARSDPFHLFAGYPTNTLSPQTVLALADTDVGASITRALAYRELVMVDFAKEVLPSTVEIRTVLEAAAIRPASALDLVAGVTSERQPFVLRSLAWLLKLGILKASL